MEQKKIIADAIRKLAQDVEDGKVELSTFSTEFINYEFQQPYPRMPKGKRIVIDLVQKELK